MMLGIHSKMDFSLFAASKLKKRIQKSAIIPFFQQTRVQNPDFDIFLQMQSRRFITLIEILRSES